MTFSIFSIAILLIFASAAAIGIYRGKERGFFKSLLFLGSSFLSITASIILSPLVSDLIMTPVFDYILPQIEAYRELTSIYFSIDTTVQTVATALLSTLIFVMIFFILRGIIYAVSLFFGAKAFKKQSDDPGYAQEKTYCGRNSKKLGSVIGFACAILATMVLTSPIMGFLDITQTALLTVEEIMPNIWESAGIDEEEIQKLKGYSNDIPGNVFYRFGGEALFGSAASAEFYGERVYLMKEIDTVSETVVDFSYVLTVLKHPELSNSEYIKYINSLSENIKKIKICHALLADFISEELTLWQSNSYYFIAKPNVPESLEYAFDCVVDICATSNKSNVRENIATFLRIYAIILDSGITGYDSSDLAGIISCLSHSGLIDKINAELDSNPNLSDINFATVAMSILTKQIDLATANSEMHDTLMHNMAEAISIVRTRGYGSMEEKLSVLTSYTDEYFTDFGIELSDEMAKYNADVFLNHFAWGSADVSPEDIETLLDTFRAK